MVSGNWDFDGGEAIFWIAALVVAVWSLGLWYTPLLRASALGDPGGTRKLRLGVTPIVALGGLLVVLRKWADPFTVSGQMDYTLMFATGGVALLGVAMLTSNLLGISYRDDTIDRRNYGAAMVHCGAVLGLMAIYAFCNMGCGPTIWTTIIPAFVATIAWIAMWLVVEMTTSISDAVTIERDTAAGLRLAGFLVAEGIILGRAMAGDWTGWGDTVSTFIGLAWPAIALPFLMLVMQRAFRATPEQPKPPAVLAGALPCIALIFGAAALAQSMGTIDIGIHVITYDEYMKS